MGYPNENPNKFVYNTLNGYKGTDIRLGVRVQFSDTTDHPVNEDPDGELGFLLDNIRLIQHQPVDVSHPVFLLEHIAGGNILTADELTSVDADADGSISLGDVLAGI
uniref:EF-hand domain-containing protein n=1 Tax=viral metagenome TaxID=1070528 RepID=A0A6C0K899_9ZZZZ